MKRVVASIAVALGLATVPAVVAAPPAAAEGVPCSVLFHMHNDPVAWDGTWRNILIFSPWGVDRIFCEKVAPNSFRAWQYDNVGNRHNLIYLGGSIPAVWFYEA